VDHLPLLLALAVVAIVGLGGLYKSYRRNERQRQIPAAARQAGLDYRAEDQFNCTAIAFPLMRAGDGRRVRNVMWRPSPGHGQAPDGHRPVRVFDYGYYDEYRDRSGQRRKRWHDYTCALVEHDGTWPQLRLSREGLADKAEHVLGDDDIDFESEEFNRMFAVRCADRRFASAFIDPQMMELLLKTGGAVSLDTMGRFLLLSADPLDPAVMPRLLAMAEDVLAHVPPAVWALYPRLPDSGGTESFPVAGSRAARDAIGAPPADPFPSLVHPDESWDPTPGVDHDLDGHVVEPSLEDPWPDRP
jgi:hypothetical protein